MGKCIITFEDKVDDDGEPGICSTVAFDPPIDNPMRGHKPTPAQSMGWSFFEAVVQRRGEDDE